MAERATRAPSTRPAEPDGVQGAPGVAGPEAGAADHLQQVDVVADHRLPVLGVLGEGEQGGGGFGRRSRKLWGAGGGHDRGEASQALAVPRRQQLGDHSAHGDPRHVGALDLERVEQTHDVQGHVVEAVGGVDGIAARRPAHGLGDIHRAGLVELGGEPRVPVVEGDDAVPALHQLRQELLGPGDALGAEPPNQQQRAARLLSEFLGVDLDSVRLAGSHLSSLGVRLGTSASLHRMPALPSRRIFASGVG